MYSKKIQNRAGPPKKIASLLASLLNDEEIKQKAESVDFFKFWDQIVGTEYSKFCKPIKLDKGVLFVEAIDSAYMQELSLQQKIFKKRITELGFGGSVSQIRFISGNPKSFKK